MEAATTTRDDQPTALPYDIIFQILSRLRVKTLCKFRCVSRSWCALISDPIFQRAHYKRSEQNPLLLIMSECLTPDCDELHFSSMDSQGTIVHEFTKTGLRQVGLASSQDLVFLETNYKDSSMWNPATQELISLPEISSLSCYDFFMMGYTSSTKEYKVLRFISERFTMRCQIFTLGGDEQCWRSVGDPPFYLWNMRSGVLMRGGLHCLYDSTRYPEFQGIAVFNMEREEWSVLPAPEQFSASPRQNFTALSKLGGLLCLTHIDLSIETIGLWMLKDYDANVWVKEYTISIPLLYDDVDIWNIYPLDIRDDGRLLMGVAEHGLQYYDPKTRSFEDAKVVEDSWFRACFYVEGLTSLGNK